MSGRDSLRAARREARAFLGGMPGNGGAAQARALPYQRIFQTSSSAQSARGRQAKVPGSSTSASSTRLSLRRAQMSSTYTSIGSNCVVATSTETGGVRIMTAASGGPLLSERMSVYVGLEHGLEP